ncbi:MAG TPA: hypothetical protein VN203_17280 [Candidatus Acidoferrum sp.]|nr:hypothetical protein [Candidatus Acidoferrum sp.]
MASNEHLKILKHGVQGWNTWRREHLELTIPQSILIRADEVIE